MTNYTKNFTGNQIAMILKDKDVLRNVSAKYLGAKDSVKLYKLLLRCTDLYNEMAKKITDTFTQQNEALIAANPDHADLLKAFATIRHDMIACNQFINEHKELEFLVPTMEANNQAIVALQNELGESVHELPFSIDIDKLEKALENKDLNIEELHNLLSAFSYAD